MIVGVSIAVRYLLVKLRVSPTIASSYILATVFLGIRGSELPAARSPRPGVRDPSGTPPRTRCRPPRGIGSGSPTCPRVPCFHRSTYKCGERAPIYRYRRAHRPASVRGVPISDRSPLRSRPGLGKLPCPPRLAGRSDARRRASVRPSGSSVRIRRRLPPEKAIRKVSTPCVLPLRVGSGVLVVQHPVRDSGSDGKRANDPTHHGTGGHRARVTPGLRTWMFGGNRTAGQIISTQSKPIQTLLRFVYV